MDDEDFAGEFFVGTGLRFVGAVGFAVEGDAEVALLAEEGEKIGWAGFFRDGGGEKDEVGLVGGVGVQPVGGGFWGLGLDGFAGLWVEAFGGAGEEDF